jgi:hypothetical protein
VEVIDDEKVVVAEALPAHHVGDLGRGVVVDRQVEQRVLAHRLLELATELGRDLVVAERAVGDAVGGDHPLGQLALRHLDRDEADAGALLRDLDRRLRADAGLAVLAVAAEDVEAAGAHVVQEAERGRDAAALTALLDAPGDLLGGREGRHRLGALLVVADPVVEADAGILDPLQHLLGRHPVPGALHRVGEGADALALAPGVADDLRVVARVRGGRAERGQLLNPRLASDLVEPGLVRGGRVQLLQLAGQRDRIDRDVVVVERLRGAEDQPVARPVEVLGLQRGEHGFASALAEHHAAEHRLLGFQVVRPDARLASRHAHRATPMGVALPGGLCEHEFTTSPFGLGVCGAGAGILKAHNQGSC